jgi:hypothetical protein
MPRSVFFDFDRESLKEPSIIVGFPPKRKTETLPYGVAASLVSTSGRKASYNETIFIARCN